MAIETKKFLKTLSRLRSKTRKLDNVKAKIQDSIQVVAQLVFQ